MAHIVKIEILVDDDQESCVTAVVNDILNVAKQGGPNGEMRGFVMDWQFVTVAPVSPELECTIRNNGYKEGMAFKKQVVIKRKSAPGIGEGVWLKNTWQS